MIRVLLSARLGEKRLTQADLARMTGIRPATINELYHEIADRVSLEHLDLICEALDCDLSDLIILVGPDEELKFQNDHAGANETSIVMAFRPDLVDFSRVKEDESNLIGIAGRHPVKESSAEYGKRIKEYTIECIYAGLRSEYPQLFEE